MITIKKYPNRRLYNTATSTYINLEGIRNLIMDGETVEIVDSKTHENVTTATLLLHALDAQIIEALVPSILVQDLMRMASNEQRLEAIESVDSSEETSESETQEEQTVPKVATVQPIDMIVATLDDDFESSDSDSEITIVRVGDPPTESDVTNLDAMNAKEVQVSMDAWSVSGEIEDSVIPSFFSQNSLDKMHSKDEDHFEVFESSDDGLFEQPETVVIRNRHSKESMTGFSRELFYQKTSVDENHNGPQSIPSESGMIESTQESIQTTVGLRFEDDENETGVSGIDPENEDRVYDAKSRDSVSALAERPSAGEKSEPILKAPSSDLIPPPQPTSKSDQMKMRLESMRNKLKR